MIETEYKCMIDSKLFDKINKCLSLNYKSNRVIQINYYYDSNDFRLDKNDITFRIRQKNENLSIEIKYPMEKDGLLRVKNEVVCSIDRVPQIIDVSNSSIVSYLDGIQFIAVVGAVVTDRTSYIIQSEIKVDIDKSYYHGIIDYELEVEFDENMKEEAFSLLKELTGGMYTVPQGGKRERYFYRLKEMSENSFVYNEQIVSALKDDVMKKM